MRALLPLFLLVVLVLGGCDSSEDSLIRINVALFNDTLTRTHLMHETEDFAPSNQVASNEERTVRIDILDPAVNQMGTPQIFRAGRNGVVIATVSCRASRTTAEDNYRVVFNANDTLTCLNW
ncbi:MAG: hypothetical protein Rubg2KO_13810 [Rubricoccaceae bacterium]